MQTILIQMSERNWTMQAVHFACALARNNQARVMLLRLMPVSYPGYLGTSFGYASPTNQEAADIHEYAATAEDYGIELSLQRMQCLTILDALPEAAEQLNAEVVFAHIPQSRIPYWRRFRIWKLERRLSHCRLFTLDKPVHAGDQVPSIEVEPMKVTEVR